MELSSLFVLAALVVAIASIIYVWRSLVTRGTGSTDGSPGSVLDASESVRRVDLGSHTFVAQAAHAELGEQGLTTRVVTLEQGAFGIGMGEQYFLVYNADDEPAVLTVVDRLLGEF